MHLQLIPENPSTLQLGSCWTIFDATVGGYAVLNNKITVHAAAPNLIRARIGQIEDTAKKEKTSDLRYNL